MIIGGGRWWVIWGLLLNHGAFTGFSVPFVAHVVLLCRHRSVLESEVLEPILVAPRTRHLTYIWTAGTSHLLDAHLDVSK